MTLNQFLAKRHLDIDPFVKKACYYAVNLMNLGTDIFHSGSHVNSILDNLDKFLDENKEISESEIDFAVLLLAICWHDVWRSGKTQKGVRTLLYQELYEGIGSMRVLGKNSEALKLDDQVVKKAKYAIRKHTRFQLFSHKTLESKLLFDMDTLENWSIDRIDRAFVKFGGIDNVPPFLFRVGKFFFEHMMLNRSSNKLFFTWSRKEYEERRAVFLSELIKLAQKYYYLYQSRHHLPPLQEITDKYSPEKPKNES